MRPSTFSKDLFSLEYQAIFVNAWNEWTKGTALLPDQEFKTRYLEELQRATR